MAKKTRTSYCLRLSPALKARLKTLAEREEKSVNAWITTAVERAVVIVERKGTKSPVASDLGNGD